MTALLEETRSATVTCPGCFNPQTWDVAASCPICHYCAHDEGRSSALLPVSTQLKNYVIGEKLGQGGFGITYRGFDLTLNMKVAIKEYYPKEMVGRSTDHQTVLLSSRDYQEPFDYCRQAFLKEAQTVAKIRHPHIVRVLNYFEMNGTAYLVMDYYEGEDLERHLKLNLRDQPSRKLPWQEAVTLLLPVLDGLQKVHQAGFMHRDIKPGNVYLTEDGLILLDFGSARQMTGAHTGSMLIFSGGYSPYEQYFESQLNRQGPWTDVYAVAATLYVMLTGHGLPSGPDRIQAQLRTQPDILKPARFFVPELPAMLDQALNQALAVEPEQRLQSVAEFRQKLEAVLAEKGEPLPSRETHKQGKKPLNVWLKTFPLAVMMVVLMAGFGYWKWQEHEEGKAAIAKIAEEQQSEQAKLLQEKAAAEQEEKAAQQTKQRFTDNDDGTTTDNQTGLIWLKNANCFGPQKWSAAMDLAKRLATGACGLSDGSVAGQWRLPSQSEWESLINPNAGQLGLPKGHPFTGLQYSICWSSTIVESNSSFAWIVYPDDGSVIVADKSEVYCVWPVRGVSGARNADP